jgi:hypothetical protein
MKWFLRRQRVQMEMGQRKSEEEMEQILAMDGDGPGTRTVLELLKVRALQLFDEAIGARNSSERDEAIGGAGAMLEAVATIEELRRRGKARLAAEQDGKETED